MFWLRSDMRPSTFWLRLAPARGALFQRPALPALPRPCQPWTPGGALLGTHTAALCWALTRRRSAGHSHGGALFGGALLRCRRSWSSGMRRRRSSSPRSNRPPAPLKRPCGPTGRCVYLVYYMYICICICILYLQQYLYLWLYLEVPVFRSVCLSLS